MNNMIYNLDNGLKISILEEHLINGVKYVIAAKIEEKEELDSLLILEVKDVDNKIQFVDVTDNEILKHIDLIIQKRMKN